MGSLKPLRRANSLDGTESGKKQNKNKTKKKLLVWEPLWFSEKVLENYQRNYQILCSAPKLKREILFHESFSQISIF